MDRTGRIVLGVAVGTAPPPPDGAPEPIEPAQEIGEIAGTLAAAAAASVPGPWIEIGLGVLSLLGLGGVGVASARAARSEGRHAGWDEAERARQDAAIREKAGAA